MERVKIDRLSPWDTIEENGFRTFPDPVRMTGLLRGTLDPMASEVAAPAGRSFSRLPLATCPKLWLWPGAGRVDSRREIQSKFHLGLTLKVERR